MADDQPLRRHRHRHRRGRRHPRPPAGPHRASGCCCSSAADYLPRERDNWDSTAVFVKGKYRAPEFWYDKHGNEFPPEVNYYVGGNTKFYGAALFRLRPEDFGELRHHGGISPAWPIELRRPRAVLHRGRAPLPGARPARRGPDRGAGQRPVRATRRSSTSRGSSSSATTWRSRACTRSTCRSASTSPRTTHGRRHPRQRLHPLRPGRRLPVPGRRASPTRR